MTSAKQAPSDIVQTHANAGEVLPASPKVNKKPAKKIKGTSSQDAQLASGNSEAVESRHQNQSDATSQPARKSVKKKKGTLAEQVSSDVTVEGAGEDLFGSPANSPAKLSGAELEKKGSPSPSAEIAGDGASESKSHTSSPLDKASSHSVPSEGVDSAKMSAQVTLGGVDAATPSSWIGPTAFLAAVGLLAGFVSSGGGGGGVAAGSTTTGGGVDGGTTAGGGATDGGTAYTITPVFGPLISGAEVRVFLYKADGTLLGEAAFDPKLGNFTYHDPSNYAGVVIARLLVGNDTNVDYRDEAQGKELALESGVSYWAVSTVVAGEPISINVNPFTSIAARLLGVGVNDKGSPSIPPGLTTKLALEANQKVAKNFGILKDDGQPVDLASSPVEPVVDQNGNSTKSNVYGKALAAFSQLDELSSKTTEELVGQFVGALQSEAPTPNSLNEFYDAVKEAAAQGLIAPQDARDIIINGLGDSAIEKIPPTVAAIAITGATGLTGTAPDGSTLTYSALNAGDTITVTVSMSESVVVTGSPTLNILVGATTRVASYVSGSGNTLIFSYQILASDTLDTDGISIPANALVLPMGTSIVDIWENPIAATAGVVSTAAVAGDGKYQVDTTAPSAGTLSLTDFADSGSNTTDKITNDNTFGLSVTGNEAGSTIAYEMSTNGGTTWSTTTAAQSNLADGSYQFRARVRDTSGNESTTVPVSVTVDTTAPSAGTLSLTDFADSGSNTTDKITNDHTFGLSVTGNEAGSTIAYEMSTNGGTTWSTTTAAQSNLADGSYQFRARVRDTSGNESTTVPVSVTVDTTAPSAGTLSLTDFADSGSNTTDKITNDHTFGLSVTGNEAGSTIAYEMSTNGGTTWSTTTAAQSNLADGSYQFRARVRDTSGNESTTVPVSVTVDTTAPSAGTLSLTDFADSGSNTTDKITNDNTFGLSVTGNEAGSTIAYEMSTNGGTTWSTTTAAQSNLADGSYQFRARVRDASGNESTTAPVSVTVDTTAPSAGTLSLTDFADSGSNTTDKITNDNTFGLSVTGNEAGSTIAYEMSTNGGTTWSTTTAAQSNLADGSYQFRARVRDTSGNESTTAPVSVTVDTVAIAGTLSLTDFADSGSNTTDKITNDHTFGLSVTGNEAGSTIAYEMSTNGGTTWSTTTAAQSNLADGSYQFRARVRDTSGNESTTAPVSVTVDTVAIAGTLSLTDFADSGSNTTDKITNDNTFGLSVTGNEAGSTIAYEMSTNGGTTWSTTTAAQSNLADGSYQFRARVRDASGNESTTAPVSVTVDATAPSAGTLSLTDFVDSGNTADSVTNDNTFGLSVTGNEAGSTIAYEMSTNDGTTWSTTTAAQSNLADGFYQFRARVRDASGNESTTAIVSTGVDREDAPYVANSLADQVFVIDGNPDTFEFTFATRANIFASPQTVNFYDPDYGDILTVSATLADGGELPSWLSFDAAARRFTGNPTEVGEIIVRVTVSDGHLSCYDDFKITSQAQAVMG